ncbi:restriction endonuclease subunit S [Nocardiopsis sp. NPDC006938]|uniref:restriction endonuclease subunit S n=1 Tax=Nocardiopsis sp. NPDC006938 TaxID=3364337 RepID=UPI00369011AF
MTEELPDGWVWASVGEVAETTLGKMLDRAKNTGEHAVPYLRNVNVQWGHIDLTDVLSMEIPPEKQELFRLQEGDLIICEGGEIGRCAMWAGGVSYMAFQKALHRVRTFRGVEAKYLLYVFEFLSRSGKLLPYATGSTIKHIPQQKLRNIRFPLPPSSEQRKITTVLEVELSRLDAADRQLARAQERLVNLRARFVEETCLGRGYASDGSARLAPAGVDDGMVPELPAGWEWKRLQEVADVVGGVTKDARKQSDPDCAEVPYLRVANVQKGELDLTQVKTIRVPPKKASQLELLPGDVLLNEGGDRDKLGRGWVWEGQIPGCIHQNHVFRARVRDEVIHPKLLSWHANEFGQRWCQANGKQSVNLASISLSKIRLLPVPVPPEEEQAELVKKLETAMSVFDRTAEQLASARVKAAALRQALLNTAFTGKLIPQDPADEPASVLLDRLKAERASVPAPKRGRRTATPKATSAPVRTSSATPTRIADDPQPVHAGEQTTLEF